MGGVGYIVVYPVYLGTRRSVREVGRMERKRGRPWKGKGTDGKVM